MAQDDLLLYQNIAAGDEEYIGIPISPNKGDLIVFNVNKDPATLSPGTNGYVLKADDAEPYGMAWVDINTLLATGGILTVPNGGTGQISHLLDAILVGNGSDPIQSFSDLSWKSGTLQISDGTTHAKILTLNPNLSGCAGITFSEGVNYLNIRLGSAVTNEGIYIDKSNDRIGIFTDTPTVELDVTGTIKSSGDINVGSALNVTGLTTLSDNIIFTNATNRSIGFSGFGESDLIIKAQTSNNNNGGDLFLSSGDTTDGGSDPGNIYIGSTSVGSFIPGDIYMKPLTPISTKVLTIDNSGKLGTAALPVSNGSNVIYVDSISSIVYSNISTKTATKTITLSHADYITNAGSKVYKITVFGNYNANAIGESVAWYINKGTSNLLYTVTIIPVDIYWCTFRLEFIVCVKSSTQSKVIETIFNSSSTAIQNNSTSVDVGSELDHGINNDIIIYNETIQSDIIITYDLVTVEEIYS